MLRMGHPVFVLTYKNDGQNYRQNDNLFDVDRASYHE